MLFDFFDALGDEEVALVDKPEEQLFWIVGEGRFFVEVIFEFIDMFYFEGLIGRFTKYASLMFASNFLVDVVFCFKGEVLGNLIFLTLDGGVR